MNPLLVALLAGLLSMAGVGALYLAFNDTPKRTRPTRPALSHAAQRDLVGAIAAGSVVMLLTRWPTGSLAIGVFVMSWRWLFVADDAKAEREKIEAIAQWLEDLRDIVRRSSVAIEKAVELVAEDTTGVLRSPMEHFVLRRRQGVRLPEALAAFADDVEHPTCDAAVAAIVLVVGGAAGGGRLYDTLDELASAARDEMRARDEIDRTRRVFQRAMRRLVTLTILFVAGLTIFASDLMSPYRTVAGQIWLLIPCGLWGTCLVWLRRLTRYDLGTRYRLRIPDGVAS
ncbi:MAG: type II secretion system F family protein [Ilumatobacter sp.]|uniref:type II secretion system F family protein n=1 Tax=Ilumatobacter sp. TaxID=1967498 RepID=UPI0039193FD7